jgi:hypothetical protein
MGDIGTAAVATPPCSLSRCPATAPFAGPAKGTAHSDQRRGVGGSGGSPHGSRGNFIEITRSEFSQLLNWAFRLPLGGQT